MIRDALYCASHPFQCFTDAIPPWAWWVIGACLVLMVVGFVWRFAKLARTFGGTPAMIGALGIVGTLAAVVVGAFVKSRGEPVSGRQPIPGETVRPGLSPSPDAPNPRPRRPLFPNAPWNQKNE